MNKNTTSVSLRKLSKAERNTLKTRILKTIEKRGVINTRDLAEAVGVGYSQIYIPLANSSEVKELKGKNRQRFWALADTKYADVRGKIASYEPTSAVRRGRPAAVAA